MPEIVAFVNRGAGSITPAIVEKVLRHLPQWKLEFTQIYEPLFPHLVDQLEFLADSVEDTAEGAYQDLPYTAFAQAVFALIYAHKKVGIIPDTGTEPGPRRRFERGAGGANPERKGVCRLCGDPKRRVVSHHQPAVGPASLQFPKAARLEVFAELLTFVDHIVMRQVGVEED